MTIPVLLLFLVGTPIFSDANSLGNDHTAKLKINKDASITCPDGFIVDGTLTKCLRVATGYDDACTESKQCSEFLSAGATCQDGRCRCLENYHYLHGKCHKSKGLFENCVKDVDCFVYAEYNAVACIENICKCRDGFYQREYSTCRRKAKDVNDGCLINSDCTFVEGAICVNQKCIVKKMVELEGGKYYYNNTKRAETTTDVTTTEATMTPPPSLVGDDCEVDEDCFSVPNSYCAADKKCTCFRAYFASETLSDCIPEIGEKCTDEAKLHVENAVCKEGQWTCGNEYIASKDNRHCNKALYYKDKCKSNELCQLLGPRAKCEGNYCICNSESYWLESKTFCWLTKKLDEECQDSYDCVAKENSVTPICQKNDDKSFCACPETSHMSESKGDKVCIENVTELGSYCVKDDDCKVENSRCHSNECQCDNHFFEHDRMCLPGLNAVCKENSDCKLNNTQCAQSKDGATCQCADNFVATPEKQCITKSAFNESCSCNLQCSVATANAFCIMKDGTIEEKDNCSSSNVGECKCLKDDYFRDGACFKKKKLGEECTKVSECFTQGGQQAFCRNGICSCDFGSKIDNNKCVPANYGNSIKMSLWSILLLAVFLYQ